MTSKLTRERIQRIIRAIDSEAYDEEEIREWLSSDEIMELSRMALAAMDSESGCLPLDYLQGHKDGLEWAARLAEANHPDTGDWLYDDPIELAKAIRKGPDMPPAQPVADSEPVENHIGSKNALDAIVSFIKSKSNPTVKCYEEVSEQLFKDNCHGIHSHVIEYILKLGEELEDLRAEQDEAQLAAVAPDERDKTVDADDHPLLWSFNEGWNACRAAMLQAGNSPAQSDCCPAQNGNSPAQHADRPVAWHHTAKCKDENHSTCCFSYSPTHDFGPRYEKPQSQPHYLPERLDYDRALHFLSTEPRKVTPETVIGGNSPVIPDGWTGNDKANAALMMLDRIETVDPVDDDRIDGIKRIVRELAAAQHDTPALNPVQSVVTVPGKWIPVSERMPEDDDFVYIWPRPDFGVELHIGQYCERNHKGGGWYAQVYEQNYGIEWHPITVTHWMPLPAGPQEVR